MLTFPPSSSQNFDSSDASSLKLIRLARPLLSLFWKQNRESHKDREGKGHRKKDKEREEIGREERTARDTCTTTSLLILKGKKENSERSRRASLSPSFSSLLPSLCHSLVTLARPLLSLF